MKARLLAAMAKALPVVVVTLRILFADARTEFEKSVQQGLRHLAEAVVSRYQEATT